MLVKGAFVVATTAIVALALSGPGTRWGWWDFRVGLLLFALAGILGAIAAVLGALARRRTVPGTPGARTATAAIVAGLIAITPLAYGFFSARRVPPIHDISTDLDDPPRFRAALPHRPGGINPAPDAIDPAVIALQRAAYPDVEPLIVGLQPDQAFRRASEIARSLEWEILASDPNERTIEATATTPWFGFRDDVVIRIRPHSGGSRVDMRSSSRVGRSDAGVNARRIRTFLRLMGS